MTTETIAAFIAANTPIGSTYRLLPIPGTELCDECPCCGAGHTLPNCPTWVAGAGEPLIAGLRAELAQAQAKLSALTKAANLAYDAIDWQLECWKTDEDDAPPSDLLNAHAALYGLLHYKPGPADNSDDLPF
jgi:hypothetical protein